MTCKTGQALQEMCHEAFLAAENKDMGAFDHILYHLLDAIALLFSAITNDSKGQALAYLVARVDEVEKKRKELDTKLRAALKLPDDAAITPAIQEQAKAEVQRIQNLGKH